MQMRTTLNLDDALLDEAMELATVDDACAFVNRVTVEQRGDSAAS